MPLPAVRVVAACRRPADSCSTSAQQAVGAVTCVCCSGHGQHAHMMPAAVIVLSFFSCSAPLIRIVCGTILLTGADRGCGCGTARPRAQLSALFVAQHQHGGVGIVRFSTSMYDYPCTAVCDRAGVFSPDLDSSLDGRARRALAAMAATADSSAVGWRRTKVFRFRNMSREGPHPCIHYLYCVTTLHTLQNLHGAWSCR